MTPQQRARALERIDEQLDELAAQRRRLLREAEPERRCSRLVRSGADDGEQGHRCGRVARYSDDLGLPLCGYHRPETHRRRVARAVSRRVAHAEQAAKGASR